jgi:hypothetical protein
MNCSSCGLQLPPGVKYCPNCGTATPYNYSTTGTAPNDATFISTPDAPQQIPPTQYASTPNETTPQASASSTQYGALPKNPYDVTPYAPYTPLPPTQPPPPPKRSTNRMGIIIGVVILVLILLAGGILALLLTSAARNSALQAQATATAHANATATANAIAATRDPYTHQGTLAFSDPLSEDNQGHSWSTDAPNCVFEGGAYHVVAPDARYGDYCMTNSTGTDLSNFVFEVQMQIIKGDGGGVDFRAGSLSTSNNYYDFYLYQDGRYELDVVNQTSTTLTSGSNAAIKQGLNQTNLVAIVAQGPLIMIYVNHQLVTKVTDNTFSHGQIGVEANPFSTNGHQTEVVYSNAKVWKL